MKTTQYYPHCLGKTILTLKEEGVESTFINPWRRVTKLIYYNKMSSNFVFSKYSEVILSDIAWYCFIISLCFLFLGLFGVAPLRSFFIFIFPLLIIFSCFLILRPFFKRKYVILYDREKEAVELLSVELKSGSEDFKNELLTRIRKSESFSLLPRNNED